MFKITEFNIAGFNCTTNSHYLTYIIIIIIFVIVISIIFLHKIWENVLFELGPTSFTDSMQCMSYLVQTMELCM